MSGSRSNIARFRGRIWAICGLPPVEWRGEIRASCGGTHGDPFHAGPRLGRGAIADGRMQTLPIVEDFDVFEHGRLRLLAGAEADLVDVLGLERGEEALHGRVDAPIEVKRLFAPGRLLWGHGRDSRRSRAPRSA